jgi:hypothetical protein
MGQEKCQWVGFGGGYYLECYWAVLLKYELVSIHKWPICPISALREKFNPRDINHMPAVKFFTRLDLDQICRFLDGHELVP